MIIWIASYPKSGNTWVRAMISALLYSKDGFFNFDQLYKIPQYPSKKYFEDLTNKYDDFNELSKYWLLSQERINLNNKKNFFKTHHMNCRIENNYFTNTTNTLASIYIVRDPRNIVTSFSNHFSLSIDDSKNYLLTPRLIGGGKKNSSLIYTPALLGTWKDHYRSWTSINKNLLVLKYEDLIIDPLYELEKIISFLKEYVIINTSNTKNNNIIKSTSFENLHKLEQEGKFGETVFNEKKNQKVKFFNLGPNNKWEKILEKNVQKELEKNFENEMKEIGYL